MKKNSLFFLAAMALIVVAGCASRSPSAPIEINTDIPNAPLTGTTQQPKVEQPKACTMEYMPVCAVVHIQCFVAPCNPVLETFGNKCQMEANPLAEFLHNGECLPTDKAPTDTTTPATNPNAGLANPASVNCEEKGGTLEIVTAVDGGQSGICHFANGKQCEERAFMRGECSDK